MFSKSSTFQYSLPPLQRGRRIINGIVFWASSISAIIFPSMTSSGTFTNVAAPELICFVRCPNILARSNLVRNGNVLCRGSIITFV